MGDRGFTKTDMERIGLFQEMGYTTINDKFKSSFLTAFNESAAKGKQLLPGGNKSKSAHQSGYFEDKFNRMMEGEGYLDPIRLRRQNRLKETQKNIGKPFLPSSVGKKSSGLGSHYGTLGGPVEAFSAQNKTAKPYKFDGKNFYTNPGKKGTGFGYTGVTIGAYHQYAPDDFDRFKELTKKDNEAHRRALKGGAFRLNMYPKSCFDENPYRSDRQLPPAKKVESKKFELKPFKPSSPAKLPGGLKAGTFDPYPAYAAEPYRDKILRPVQVINKSGKIFVPTPDLKSTPMNSIVNQNVQKTLNTQNYKSIKSVMSY